MSLNKHVITLSGENLFLTGNERSHSVCKSLCHVFFHNIKYKHVPKFAELNNLCKINYQII